MPALKYRAKMPRPDDPEIIAAHDRMLPRPRSAPPSQRQRVVDEPRRDVLEARDRVAQPARAIPRQPYARLCPRPPAAV